MMSFLGRIWPAVLMVCGGLLLGAAGTACAAAVVERIDLSGPPGQVRIGLSTRADYKVLTLGDRELMVAFNGAHLSGRVEKNGGAPHLVTRVRIERLPDRVVAMRFSTEVDIAHVHSAWEAQQPVLILHIATVSAPSQDMIPSKRPKFSKGDRRMPPAAAPAVMPTVSDAATSPPAAVPQVAAQRREVSDDVSGSGSSETPSPVLVPGPAAGVNMSPAPSQGVGGLDGLLDVMADGPCGHDSEVLAEALAMSRKGWWKKVFDLAAAHLDPTGTADCQAELYYLRAYAGFKMNRAGQSRLYLDAVNYFQGALSYFPDVPYTPYGMVALGRVYASLDNMVEAAGYLGIVLKTYPTHAICAEARYALGKLYAQEGKREKAIALFREFLQLHPQSPHLPAVQRELGKTLYAADAFAEALTMLRKSLEADPGSIYTDPELLVAIGNLEYHLGNTDGARRALLKAVNLFPEGASVPVLMSRVADTLREDGASEKAMKLYDLVMADHPGTDGFAISAMRRAAFLPEPADRAAAYRQVIDQFPDHPMAKLALVKTADLQMQAGGYAAAIDTLRDTVAGGVKDLKNEAVYLMEAALEGYFAELQAAGANMAVIAAYEKNKTLMRRVGNPKLFEMAGAAFFREHLYPQAVDVLEKAFGLSSPAGRSSALYYQLGVALQETRKIQQAKEIFFSYFNRIPPADIVPDAYLRMGRMLGDEGAQDQAFRFLKAGYLQTEDKVAKADMLCAQARLHIKAGVPDAVPPLVIKAINLLADAEQEGKRLTQAYRMLGDAYLQGEAYEQAVDAFSMALKYDPTLRPPELLYQLAEAQLKARKPDAAKAVLSEIVAGGDDFWARMARERLDTIAMEQRLAGAS